MNRVFLPFFDLGLGGVQSKIIWLANELSKKGYEVWIPIATTTQEFSRVDQLNPQVKLIVCPSWLNKTLQRGYCLWITYLILRYQPQTVVLSLEDLAVQVIQYLQFFNWVPGTRKSKLLVNMDIYLKPVQKYSDSIVRKTLEKADTVIAVSRQCQDDLVTRLGLEKNKVQYIPNWPTLQVKQPQKELSKRRLDLVFIGRLEPQKRPERCLIYLKMLLKKEANRKLYFFGNGSLKERLQDLVKKNKLQSHVVFYPATTEVKTILAETRNVVLFSDYEGCPMGILEAEKFGCNLILGSEVKKTLPTAREMIDAKETFLALFEI